jgi:lipopolysaccharide transport protein LptA
MNSQSTSSSALARGCAVSFLLLSATPWVMGATKTEEHPPQISYDAASMEADVKTHMIHLKDVTITYGKMTVRADRALATAGDFKDSRWTFDGNVRINAVPRGNLRSDQAVVEFEDNQLKRATATGNPAEFDQTRDDSNIIARGHADQIVYEVGTGTIRLSKTPSCSRPAGCDAFVADGRDDIHAPVIVYSLRDEKVEASTAGGTDGRVHVTIAPGEGPRDGGATNKARPPQPDSGKPQPPPQSALPEGPAAQPSDGTNTTPPGPAVSAAAASSPLSP